MCLENLFRGTFSKQQMSLHFPTTRHPNVSDYAGTNLMTTKDFFFLPIATQHRVLVHAWLNLSCFVSCGVEIILPMISSSTFQIAHPKERIAVLYVTLKGCLEITRAKGWESSSNAIQSLGANCLAIGTWLQFRFDPRFGNYRATSKYQQSWSGWSCSVMLRSTRRQSRR